MAKGSTVKPNETKFMFVHNDDDSAAQKKSVIDFSARSHVMSEYKRKEKVAGLVWLKKNSSSIDNFMSANRKAEKQSQISRLTLRHGRVQESDVWASNQDEAERLELQQVEHRTRLGSSIQHDLQHYRQPAPAIIFLNGGADDPFSSASIRLDSWMHGLIRYFIGVCMPSLFAVQTKDHQYFQHTSGVLEDVVSALSDASHMNALLAMSSAHMEVQKGALINTDPRSKGSVYFKGRAMNLLQKRLSNDINDVDFEMMQAIMKLSAAESIAGNYQAQLVHVRAWCRIVSILGGIQKFDWRIVESDITTGIKTTLPIMGKVPILPGDWSPIQIPDERQTIILPPQVSPLNTLGRRLLEEGSAALFQDEFVSLLKDMCPLVKMADFTVTRPEEAIPADYHWLRISTLAMAHRLCTFPLNYPELKPYPSCSIQWSVRVTMLLYADATLINQVPKAALVPELKQALGTSPLNVFWSPWTDILLWVLCIGLHAAEGMAEEPWFTSQVAETAEFLQIGLWDEVAPILREFFYLDRVHGKALERLWTNVEVLFERNSAGRRRHDASPPPLEDENPSARLLDPHLPWLLPRSSSTSD